MLTFWNVDFIGHQNISLDMGHCHVKSFRIGLKRQEKVISITKNTVDVEFQLQRFIFEGNSSFTN